MNKKILVAPLNWGLGHATRCIPIIRALIAHNFTPILASDGAALTLLVKEFPDLEALALPSYNITYAKKGHYLKLKIFKDSPKILRTIRKEHNEIQKIVKTHAIDGIISDNRFGIFHKDVPSVFITHQLRVLSGSTTWLSSMLHQKTIKRFDECWVPDNFGPYNLSGKMGHIDDSKLNIKYIGILSRFEKKSSEIMYDIMVLLSGPEPQRTILENKLLEEFKKHQGKVLFVKGVVEDEQRIEESGNLTIYNFMTTDLLEKSINSSRLVVARSGYTTIMDLAKLKKKAFFIPTPGQFEQYYLAKRMQDNHLAPFCKQNDFNLKKLEAIDNYKGLSIIENSSNFKELFHLFERK
ncbi:glycosyltransferase [Gelidibacter maritimus]|uniref:Glycosyltransferase n=1 Tax=Gelidibacter maritimus TaxID=2761487 RepID=A0A7W2M2S1_9FLAO|nr:glycosyltransferase [Gelidibacter maritimus]MBA6151591.1 glycosyltransferase [Gelidibacter maritimus]